MRTCVSVCMFAYCMYVCVDGGGAFVHACVGCECVCMRMYSNIYPPFITISSSLLLLYSLQALQ